MKRTHNKCVIHKTSELEQHFQICVLYKIYYVAPELIALPNNFLVDQKMMMTTMIMLSKKFYSFALLSITRVIKLLVPTQDLPKY